VFLPDQQALQDRVETNADPFAQNAQSARSPARREEDMLDEFRHRFSESQSEQSRPGASSGLFAFAADDETHKVLKNWSPFDSHILSPADILLGLLMGLWRRGDLLDRYTFSEFFCVWPHVQSLGDRAEDWIRRTIGRIDHRISRIGILTFKEIQLFMEYDSFYNEDCFSISTRDVLRADVEYHRYRIDLSSARYIFLDQKAKTIVDDALVRMRTRHTNSSKSGSESLLFCTSGIMPDVGSIFLLGQRRQVAEESKGLFSAELIMAHEFLARCGYSSVFRRDET
jgi:hypothetical protein